MRLFPVLILAAGLPAQADPQWVCVPGEGGKWRCNQGSEPTTAAPLPALQAPAEPVLQAFGLGNQPAPPPTPIIDQLLPAQTAPDQTDRYTLKIASVSSVDDIAGFVESYGLDPKLIRFMPVTEGGVTRQLIMWGSFSSQSQAARALVAMPTVVRAMRPRVSETASLDVAPQTLASLASQPATPARRPRPAAAAAAATPAESDSAQRRPPAAFADTPPVDLAELQEARPASRPGPARTPSGAGTESPAKPPRASPASTRPPSASPLQAQPATTSATRPSGFQPVARPTATTTPQLALAVPGVAEPASRQPLRSGKPAGAARQTADPAVLGADRFAALDENHFTLQLTSLGSTELVAGYLRRHGLEAGRVYAIPLDEGAGPRILILFGDFASYSAAEVAAQSLPASIRSPWVRRVSPVQRSIRGNP